MATFRMRAITPTLVASLAGAPSALPAAAGDDGKPADVTPEAVYSVAAVVLLLAGLLIGLGFQHPAFTPASGISIFAVMYIVAQAVERLQEPFVPWLGRAGGSTDQPTAKAKRDKAVTEAINSPTKDKADAAALAQRTVDQIRANLTLLLWASSSALAMIASGFFGLYLLAGVGVNQPPIWMDIALTGIAIGGGTKPLHDLITNISESKQAKQDPAETS